MKIHCTFLPLLMSLVSGFKACSAEVILQVQSDENVTRSDYLDDFSAALAMITLSDFSHLVMCVGTHNTPSHTHIFSVSLLELELKFTSLLTRTQTSSLLTTIIHNPSFELNYLELKQLL